MRPARLAVPLALVLALGACATQREATQVTLPVTQTAIAHVPATPGADDNLNAVLWIQSSAEYEAAARSLYNAATARLDEALADPRWDALAAGERDNAAALATLPPAVIMDVDETVLDNSPYQARLVRDGGAYDAGTWAAWVDERAARAVPGVAAFARAAAARGVTIVYLTNRTEQMQDATLDNLRALGLPVAGESVFLGKGTAGCEQAGSDKDCRRRQVAARYRVLMQFGDQLGDFVAVADEAPAARQALVDRHGGWFGERWWMLPNPTYGDWEPALFGNDWSLPAERRRAAKRAALDAGGR
jgi:acid phosphatase